MLACRNQRVLCLSLRGAIFYTHFRASSSIPIRYGYLSPLLSSPNATGPVVRIFYAYVLGQDIVPATGLTVFKPSRIWPPPAPPPGDVGGCIHGTVKPEPSSEAKAPAITAGQRDIQPKFELDSETPAASEELDQTIRVEGMDGNSSEITRQIQLYTTNKLLKHPLVSPVLAYLGGLPPLFVIASDREVLRDEIIYTLVYFSNSGLKGEYSLFNEFPVPIVLRIQRSIQCWMRRRGCTRHLPVSKDA